MRDVIKHSIRFLFFVVIQTLIFNPLEIGFQIHPMIYPLFIMLLPFETSVVWMMVIAFATGFSIDIMSNTGGLHASSLLAFAFFRPIIFKLFSPRDGYDPNKEGSVYEMGQRWFLLSFGTLLIIHHLWFFALEAFSFNELLAVFRKTVLSVPVSFIFCIILQLIFLKRSKEL